MAERAYLSIGDVLGLLREEFPDITISKIRFLESQGLLDPERTPSGYRKFYDEDVERLRWILRQQRENFLPLKVIKGRLEHELAPNGREEALPAPGGPSSGGDGAVGGGGEGSGDVAEDREERTAEPAPERGAARAQTARDAVLSSLPDEEVTRPGPPADQGHRPAIPQTAMSAGPSGAHLTRDELSSASALSIDDLVRLESFGLLEGETIGGTTYYDEESLTVATLAAGFRHFGVEARHLRTYKNAADREAGLFEQIIIPLLKQRNPESRKRAVESLSELARLGAGMRASLLRRSLKGYTGG